MQRNPARWAERLIVWYIVLNLGLAAMNALGALPAPTWGWTVALAEAGTAFWAGVALRFMTLNDRLLADREKAPAPTGHTE